MENHNHLETYSVDKHVTLKFGVIKELFTTAIMRTLELYSNRQLMIKFR